MDNGHFPHHARCDVVHKFRKMRAATIARVGLGRDTKAWTCATSMGSPSDASDACKRRPARAIIARSTHTGRIARSTRRPCKAFLACFTRANRQPPPQRLKLELAAPWLQGAQQIPQMRDQVPLCVDHMRRSTRSRRSGGSRRPTHLQAPLSSPELLHLSSHLALGLRQLAHGRPQKEAEVVAHAPHDPEPDESTPPTSACAVASRRVPMSTTSHFVGFEKRCPRSARPHRRPALALPKTPRCSRGRRPRLHAVVPPSLPEGLIARRRHTTHRRAGVALLCQRSPCLRA